ncbi:flavodoxin family protein [Fructilactobacillus sp. Tb1]|uniref:flavodoxin family protein n=1 Tax=Fructilactobacillus sp. Tb1 TaxID=3422304 RepID=UPI003D278829
MNNGKVILIESSSRNKSNSNYLANLVLKNIKHELINLNEIKIDKIRDHRFDGNWDDSKDDFYKYIKKLEKSEYVIIASPVYWYSFSTNLKIFIDRWSESLKKDNQFKNSMKDKKIILVLVGGDNPRIKALPIINQMQYICDFLNMNFFDYVIGFGNHFGDIKKDKEAIEKGNCINYRLVNKGEE